MMMAADDPKVLVLRSPERQGNYSFRVAKLPDSEARRLEERLARGDSWSPTDFSAPMTLVEVMEQLEVRDFKVLDLPAHH